MWSPYLKVPSYESVYDQRSSASGSGQRRPSFKGGGDILRFRSSSPLPTPPCTSPLSPKPAYRTESFPGVLLPSSPTGDDESLQQIRKVTLKRKSTGGGESLGFSIRGGERGIYVAHVDHDSHAQKAGLRTGDQILAANHLSFLDIGRQEAAQLMEATKSLHLTVLPPSPVPTRSSPHRFTWVDRSGRPASPPLHHAGSESSGDLQEPVFSRRRSFHRQHGDYDKRTVSLEVLQGQSLGLMIRGGAEYGLGVFVSGVDRHSVAEIVGLQVGDQILSVNGRDFRCVRHKEAAEILKHSPRMTLRVRRLGKVPQALSSASSASSSSYGGRLIPSSRVSRKGRSMRDPENETCEVENAEQRVDAKAHQMLSEGERLSLAYYYNEYETQAMTVDALVAVLLELLETPEKYTLMTEIRNLVRPGDIDKFDELIYRREMQAMKSKEAMKMTSEDQDGMMATSPMRERSRSFRVSVRRNGDHLTVPESKGHCQQQRETGDQTASEDSGVDLANGAAAAAAAGHYRGSRVSLASRDSEGRRTSSASALRHQQAVARRSSDGVSMRTSAATELRRTTLRRHSSGGEGVNPADVGKGVTHPEERRWSIGSQPPSQDADQDAPSQGEDIEMQDMDNRDIRPELMVDPVVEPIVPVPIAVPSVVSKEQQQMWLEVPHVRVRRHRSLPDPASCSPQSPSGGQHRKRSSGQQPQHEEGHRVISEGNNYRVFVKKTRPLLGIAIEGGTNTSQPVPRIISIHASGAAFEAGSLKVGHIILEVDGLSLSRRRHDEAAKLIAECFYDSHRDHVEFLVTEKARTLVDLQRSSQFLFD